MLAAEFHYNKTYCDRYLDLDEIISHIRYHQANPPAGAVITSIIKSFFGKDEDQHDHTPSPVFTPEVKSKLEGMSMDEKFNYLSTLPLTPEQMTQSRSLDHFMDDFGAVGGQVK